jgi:hypothetical protein
MFVLFVLVLFVFVLFVFVLFVSVLFLSHRVAAGLLAMVHGLSPSDLR